jgi:hypothetical protein
MDDSPHYAKQAYESVKRLLWCAKCCIWALFVAVKDEAIKTPFTVLLFLATCTYALITLFQLNAMRDQLDVMRDDKRPWIKVAVTIEKPLHFTDWNGTKGVNALLHFDLTNYGDAPAVNIRIVPQIMQHPGNPKRSELDIPQKDTCERARAQADENAIGGIAIFPKESVQIETANATFTPYPKFWRVEPPGYPCSHCFRNSSTSVVVPAPQSSDTNKESAAPQANSDARAAVDCSTAGASILDAPPA